MGVVVRGKARDVWRPSNSTARLALLCPTARASPILGYTGSFLLTLLAQAAPVYTLLAFISKRSPASSSECLGTN